MKTLPIRTPTWLKLYEVLVQLEEEIEETLPEFQELAIILQYVFIIFFSLSFSLLSSLPLTSHPPFPETLTKLSPPPTPPPPLTPPPFASASSPPSPPTTPSPNVFATFLSPRAPQSGEVRIGSSEHSRRGVGCIWGRSWGC